MSRVDRRPPGPATTGPEAATANRRPILSPPWSRRQSSLSTRGDAERQAVPLRRSEGTFEYDPQHTTVEFEQGGDEVVRPYTPTSLPGTDEVTLAIKRYDDGTASVWMHERDRGDEVELGELEGNLYLRGTELDAAFVSTGTGITPMMAMLKD